MNVAAESRGRIVTRRGLIAFRWLLTRRRELSVESHAGVFFIGLGDLLDDDRRLVRAATLPLREATGPRSPDASRSG